MTPQERIKADAESACELRKEQIACAGHYQQIRDYISGYKDGYIAGATAENQRAQGLVDALDQFISYHETGLLPARHVYEQAVAARQQWKSGKGKEVEE